METCQKYKQLNFAGFFFSILKYAKPGCMEMTVLRSVEPASIPLLVITYLEVVISDVLQDGKIHHCAMKVQ